MNEIACNQNVVNGSAGGAHPAHRRLNRHQSHNLNQLRSEVNNNSDVGKLLRYRNNKDGTNGLGGGGGDKELASGGHRDYNSSSGSDISEDVELSALQDVVVNATQPTQDVGLIDSLKEESRCVTEKRRFRSMSDGSPILNGVNPDGEPYEVFPSLPDSVLDKLGLLGNQTQKERLNNEELEQKFVSLSLAFTIDAATIRNRCDRQRRCRDQTETNLNAEIERLVEKAHRLRPLCVDAETTELLTALLGQVDVIVRAADHAAISAERYGAVQHEERLAESVQLMINHVHVLKQQRDSARRQLQYTKRVLQDTNVPDAAAVSKQRAAALLNGHPARMVTRRRASIATISQPLYDVHQQTNADANFARKITRRTSELTLRGSILSRSSRPARLELGLDLVKIRENTVENHVPDVVAEENEDFDGADHNLLASTACQSYPVEQHESTDYENDQTTSTSLSQEEDTQREMQIQISQGKLVITNTAHLKYTLINSVRKISRNCGNALNIWLDEGAKGNFFYLCALMCFSLSIISLANVLVEMEYERNDKSFLYWFYKT